MTKQLENIDHNNKTIQLNTLLPIKTLLAETRTLLGQEIKAIDNFELGKGKLLKMANTKIDNYV